MISRNARALLDTIALAEGTAGPQGYNTMFTHRTFGDLSRHPRQVNRSNGYASDAAGRYQFLSTTWDGVAKELGLQDFSPQSQDVAALQLVRRRGVDPDQPLTRETLAKLAPEWASLPTLEGRSYYGQPVRPADKLLGHYQQRLGGAGGDMPAAGGPPGAQQQPMAQPQAPGFDDWSPQGVDPVRMAGMMASQLGMPRNKDNAVADVAMAAVGGRQPQRFVQSEGYRQALAAAVQPMAERRQADLTGGFGAYNALMGDAIGALTPAQAAPQPSMATAGSGGMPALQQQGGGGPIRVGRIADPSEDVFPTTGAHLDVRIMTPGGKYINPKTNRSLLQHLRVAGRPLYEQRDGDWLPTQPVTSGFGPRNAPTAGASTFHNGIDYGIAAQTPLEWTGGGQYSFEGGIGRIRLSDGTTVKLLHTRPS